MATSASDNPVLAAWEGPHGGAPAFDELAVEQFIPALEAAIAEKRAEVAAIADNPEPPTFANTLEALEASGPAADPRRRGSTASTPRR